MASLPTLVLVLMAAGEPLGPVVREEAFQFRPPRDFRMARMDLFHGTRVAAITRRPNPEVEGYLSAALLDGDGEDAASLLLAVIDEPLALGPSVRGEFSSAVARHLGNELGQPFQLERAEVTNGRVEVLGSIRQGSQLRRVLAAAWPGEVRHVVALCSAPSGRWDALAPLISASLDSLKPEPVTTARPPQRLLWAFIALLGALMMISVGLWRRRQAARAQRG